LQQNFVTCAALKFDWPKAHVQHHAGSTSAELSAATAVIVITLTLLLYSRPREQQSIITIMST
jgi:hypothetical protein